MSKFKISKDFKIKSMTSPRDNKTEKTKVKKILKVKIAANIKVAKKVISWKKDA